MKKRLHSDLKKDASYISMGQATSDLGVVLGCKKQQGDLIPFYHDQDNSILAGYAYEDQFKCQ